jgi:hypothetical protein
MKKVGLASLSCLLGLAACQSPPSGTRTRLADLMKTSLNVGLLPGAPPATRRIRVQVDFEDAGAMDDTGARCPVLRDEARATIDGQPATFTDRGGPERQRSPSTEYYLCRPFRFVSPSLAPPFDHPIAVSLGDGSRAYRVRVDGLLEDLLEDNEPKRARVVDCSPGLRCTTDSYDWWARLISTANNDRPERSR